VEFTLRDSRREDFDRLWKLDQECFPPAISYSRVELAIYMRRSGAFTVVAEAAAGNHSGPAKAAVLGFIVAEASRRGLGHIITIDVQPGARRCGVGSRLLTAAEERLRTAGCSLVFLETAVDNRSAFTFYKRHGYFLVKTVPRYYSNGVDAFVLRKDLLSAAEAG
jgi:ribosomal-protein-alanine N-acetyltransferase